MVICLEYISGPYHVDRYTDLVSISLSSVQPSAPGPGSGYRLHTEQTLRNPMNRSRKKLSIKTVVFYIIELGFIRTIIIKQRLATERVDDLVRFVLQRGLFSVAK